MHTHTLVRVAAIMAGLSLMGAGCNPFAPLQQRMEQRIGEEIGEGLIEGMAGGGADLELGTLPADFPSDIPRYPDAEYVSAVVMNDGKVAIANFSVNDSPEEIVAWFDAEMAASGFELDEGMVKLGLFRIFKKDKVTVTLQTQSRDGKTYVSVQRAEQK